MEICSRWIQQSHLWNAHFYQHNDRSFLFYLTSPSPHSRTYSQLLERPLLLKQTITAFNINSRCPVCKVKCHSNKSKHTASTTNNSNVINFTSVTTTPIISSGNTQKTILSLWDLLFEFFSQVAGYLSRKGIHACVFLSWTISHLFIPHLFIHHLWQYLDHTLCFTKAPESTQLDRFLRFKSSLTDTSALSRNGPHIRSLKGVYVEWLAVFDQQDCNNLRYLEVVGYLSCPQERLESADADTTLKLSKTLRLFLEDQPDIFQKLNLSGRILCSNETKTDHGTRVSSVAGQLPRLRVLSYPVWHLETENTKKVVIDESHRQYVSKRRKANQVSNAVPAFISTSSVSSPSTDVVSGEIMKLECHPRLKKLTFNRSRIDRPGITQLLPWLPALENLALFDSNILRPVDFAQFLQTHCPLLSSLCISRNGREHYIPSSQ